MRERTGRLRPLRDVLIALFVLGASLGAMSGDRWEGQDREPGGEHELDGLGFGLALAMTLPLVGRRLAPLPVLGVVSAATAALYALDYGFPPLAFAVAVYTAARWREEGQSTVLALAAGASLVVVVVPALVRGGLGPEVFAGFAVWAGTLFAGDRMRIRGARAAELGEQAREAERAAERERRLASAEERTRIARDLHDSAGHAVNVILVQAGAARLLLERDPAGSRTAIETIEDVARETLVEIDQLVRALRETGATDGVEPPAGLAALQTLVDRSRAAGLDLDVTIEGERRTLPPAVDQAAYRILREALTNASRHGTGGATVSTRYGPAALRLTVTNPVEADSAASVGSGHGLVGMRERAALLGGSLTTDLSAGQFRLEASLPYREAS